MTDFAVSGKKRSGKGLFCAGLIRDAMRSGRRVATNMDIFPEHLLPSSSRATLIRLPDCPTAEDMEAIGKGYEGDVIDEERNGIIVLDEASKFFNARQWGDKTRQPLLDWLIHSGKARWDVYYQMQGLEQVDKQLRNTQVEYHVAVKRTDRWPIPVVTQVASLIGLDIRLPKMHLGIYKHGVDRDSMVVDRKWYRARDIYAGYDTEQVFLDRDHPDACGLHTVLSAWHLKGRHEPPPLGFFGRLLAAANPPPRPRPTTPKHPVVALLAKLPPDQALKHWHRLNSRGAFDPAPTAG